MSRVATGEEPIFERARQFLAFVLDAPSPSLERLELELDRLAVALNETPPGQATDYEAVSIPRPSREFLSGRFPSLGLYRSTTYSLELEDELTVGDGVDDLLDITDEMQRLLHHLDAAGADEALFELHALGWHWMGHLRGLTGYLHFMRHEEPNSAESSAT